MTTKNLQDSLRIKGICRGGAWPVFVMGSALALSGNLAAAPGELSQTPLFLTFGVQPNVFMLLDDSGSMDFEIVRSDGTPVDADDGLVNFTPDENDEEKNLRLCAGYNVLAYDPDFDYSAWSGLDMDGNPFQDLQNPEAAQVNPYTGSGGGSLCDSSGEVRNNNGETCDLLAGGDFGSDGAFYYVRDKQTGECPTDPGSRVYVEGLLPGEQQNYANWFSYYRKRQYVLKRALSQVVANSQARVGMATINQGDHVTKEDPVGTPVKDLRDAANKEILLDNLLGIAIDAGSITPLRIGLKRTGDYFSGPSGPQLRDLFGFIPEEDPDSASGHSPILDSTLGGECQQNFALVVSDGFWNGPSGPQVDNADGDNNSPYDGKSYADPYADTLADTAMHFYETDLIDTLPDNVPATPILKGMDVNPQQHLVTFTVAFGTNGTLAADPLNREDPFVWPRPLPNDPTTVDDMRHAAWNGRGLFLSAKEPEGLISELDKAIGDIGSRTATAAAAVAVNSTSLRNDTLVYQAGFESEFWSGTLSAFQLTGAGLGAEPKWKAHDKLNGRLLGADPRVMISFNGSKGVAFQFPINYPTRGDADLSAEQISDLLMDAPWPSDPDPVEPQEIDDNKAFGNDLVDYLRGVRSKEGETFDDFRKRGGRLADIIDSAPVFVGAPDPALYPDGIQSADPADSYQAWANSVKDRTEMVYVGTNGGTLHGFVAEVDPDPTKDLGGHEVFAYFPQLIFSDANDAGLHLLARQSYNHRYYVDNTPTVTEVFTRTRENNSASWRTILVGTLRSGGKGLFALDVSDPDIGFDDETAAAGKVLWEFTDPDLGFTFSRPTLAKLNNGRWAAIFGNGYNADDGDGTAKLFIHYLDDFDHSEVQILETNSGSIANSDCRDVLSDCNGLATPAVVDLTGDGIADRVYAGDLKGNLWVFDLTGDNTSEKWDLAYPGPLFTAQVDENSDGIFEPQPITTQPAVTRHLTERSVDTEPNTLVFFGTGQFIVAGDSQTTGVQSFYGIWDAKERIAGGRDDLQSQTINPAEELTIGSDTFDIRTLSSNPVNYKEKKGWYVDFLEESGERVVVNPLLFGELVVYTTLIPSGNQCGLAGNSWLMVHDFSTGGEPSDIALDLNNNGSWEEEKLTGVTAAGVSTGDLFWQPTIVQSGTGAEGTVLLPKDAREGDDSTLKTQKIRGAGNAAVRSSWARFEFD